MTRYEAYKEMACMVKDELPLFAGKEFIDKIYDEIEQLKKDYNADKQDMKTEIQRLMKDRDYWKLSFNKQVEASRNAK